MKHKRYKEAYKREESHPAWVCGLKRAILEQARKEVKVTPCVGVWIETKGFVSVIDEDEVTPCVGVWIETYFDSQ